MTAKKRLPDDLTFISDKKRRDVSYCKRKRGLIKKIIELSNLCHHDIYLCIFEKEKQKIVEYRTDASFNSEIVSGLLNPDILMELQHELYTNKTHQEQFMSRDEDVDPLASDQDTAMNNKSAFKRLTGSMGNIKNNFKETHENDQNENQFIDNATVQNFEEVQKLKQKLVGYLIPENQRKGKRKACIKRNQKIQEKLNYQCLQEGKDNSSEEIILNTDDEILKRRKQNEEQQIVKPQLEDKQEVPVTKVVAPVTLIEGKPVEQRIFQTVFHPKIVSKPIEEQDILSAQNLPSYVVKSTKSWCSANIQEENKQIDYEQSSENFSFENIGAKLFKPKPVVKQEYLKQIAPPLPPVDQNEKDIENQYFQKQRKISQTEINSPENQSDNKKGDPTKLQTFSKINFECFKPNIKERFRSFSFSAKDRDLLNQKGPEFKFKDYHHLINNFITMRNGKASKEETEIQELSDPIQSKEIELK